MKFNSDETGNVAEQKSYHVNNRVTGLVDKLFESPPADNNDKEMVEYIGGILIRNVNLHDENE